MKRPKNVERELAQLGLHRWNEKYSAYAASMCNFRWRAHDHGVPDEFISKEDHMFAENFGRKVAMPYVNEYVPEEDVQKYVLNEIWNKYSPFNRVPRAGFQLTWTVSRESESFLMRVWIGREEQARMNIFIFRFAGVTYEVKLEYHSSGRTDQSPYFINWRLLELNPEPSDKQMRSEVLASLAQALQTFGYWGIVRQIPNTVVELDCQGS